MDKLIIKGGKKLKGEVTVSGSKNAALPIFVATILAPGINQISNVPFLRDINTTIKVLESLGARVEGNGHIVKIDSSGINSHEATYDLVKTMRASVLVLGPLLARFGKARVSLPGGCAIGARPINLHLKGLQPLEMKVDRPGADGATAGKRDPGRAKTGQERPQHQHRGPHGLDQVIGGFVAVDSGGVDLHQVPVPFHPCTERLQHLDGGIDVAQKRHIADLVDTGGQDRGDKDRQSGVLRPADRHFTLQFFATLYDELIQSEFLLTLLSRVRD